MKTITGSVFQIGDIKLDEEWISGIVIETPKDQIEAVLSKCVGNLAVVELSESPTAKEVNRSHDPVNHPKHYTGHPSGIECIQITEHMGFCLGNAVKYIWRADLKNDAIEDLKKAVWYINREIEKRERK